MATKKYRDIPQEEFIEKMKNLTDKGWTVFVKFTCLECGSRQTCITPNAFFTQGYKCEACNTITYPKKFGMMVMKAF